MIESSHGMAVPRRPIERRSLATAALLIAAIFTVLLLAPTASHAALMSAQDLLTACSGDAMARATCDGYLMATTDLALRRESNGRTNARLCVPPTVTVDQVREAVLNFGQGRAVRAPAGLGLVAAAMHRTWPCQGSPREPGPDQPGGNRGGPWPRQNPGLPGEPGAPRDQ
jgi:hypothetical protein